MVGSGEGQTSKRLEFVLQDGDLHGKEEATPGGGSKNVNRLGLGSVAELQTLL